MSDFHASKISLAVAQAIQEAVLLGNTKEIGGVLDLVRGDETFPKNLRYGLEAMLFFRSYYGKGGELEPNAAKDKKRMFDLDVFWGQELIESLDWYSSPAAFRQNVSE